MEINEDSLLKRRVDVLRMQVLHDLQVAMPQTIALDVAGVRFLVVVIAEEAIKAWDRASDSRRPVMQLSAKEGEGADVKFPKFSSENLGIRLSSKSISDKSGRIDAIGRKTSRDCIRGSDSQ